MGCLALYMYTPTRRYQIQTTLGKVYLLNMYTLTLSVADDTDSVRFASSYSAMWAGMLFSTAVNKLELSDLPTLYLCVHACILTILVVYVHHSTIIIHVHTVHIH